MIAIGPSRSRRARRPRPAVDVTYDLVLGVPMVIDVDYESDVGDEELGMSVADPVEGI